MATMRLTLVRPELLSRSVSAPSEASPVDRGVVSAARGAPDGVLSECVRWKRAHGAPELALVAAVQGGRENRGAVVVVVTIGEKDAPADDGEHEVEARCGVFGEGTDALGIEAVGIHAEYGIGLPPGDIAPGEIEGAAGGAEVIGRMEVVALPYPLEFGAVGAQAIDARPAADIVPVPVGGRKAL